MKRRERRAPGNPIGIDYHPASNALIASVNWHTGATNNFVRIGTNGAVSPWTTLRGVPDDVRLAAVKVTTNGGRLKFGPGQVFHQPGQRAGGQNRNLV